MRERLTRLFGLPLIQAELARQSRRWRTHVSRWAYLLVLAIGFGFLWYILDVERGGPPGGVADMVVVIFAVVSWIQLILLGVGAAHTSGSMIAEERNRDTLEVLLSTPFSSFGILFGKYLSTLLRTALYVLAVLPLFGLLMLEGGIAPLQIAGVAVLTLCFVTWCATISTLGSTFNHRENAGAGAVLGLMILYVIGVSLAEQLPGILQRAQVSWAGSVPTLSEDVWLMLNIFKLFAQVSTGQGSVFGGTDWQMHLLWLLGWHVLLAAGICVAGLGLTAWALRPIAQLGKVTLWRALWLFVFGPRRRKDPPRRRWEQGRPRPWFGAVYVWRNLAPAASPQARRLRYVVVCVLTLAVIFAPFVFYAAEFAIRYPVFAVREIAADRGFPPLPDHPLMEGGRLYRERASGRTLRFRHSRAYHDAQDEDHLYRNPRDSLRAFHGWSRFFGSILAPIVVVLVAFGTTAAAAREREKRRFPVLLSTPLSNAQLASGLIAQGVSGYGFGLLLAVPLVLVAGVAGGSFPLAPTAGLVVYMVTCGLFFTALGLRFGLLSKTVRIAQAKLGAAYIGVAVFWPMAVWMVAAISSIFSRGPGPPVFAFWLSALSPFFLPGYIVSGFSEGTGREHTAMALGALMSLILYGILGLSTFLSVAGLLRRHAQRKG